MPSLNRVVLSLVFGLGMPVGAQAQEAQAHIPVLPSATDAAAPKTVAALPNGASSIEETYGDWTVSCTVDNARKICGISQSQGDKQTGRRSFAIELQPPRSGRSDGTILVPFGMNLDSGALLKLDDKDLGKGLRFSTCVPQGCLLPVSLPDVATTAMRSAQKLTVAMLQMESGQAMTFTVSLKGFPAALDRIASLDR